MTSVFGVVVGTNSIGRRSLYRLRGCDVVSCVCECVQTGLEVNQVDGKISRGISCA